MANKRISTLDDISLVGGTSTPGLTTSDIIPVTDVDDTTGSLQGTTKKVTVANLVAVAPQGDLESANNLSDLANAATARTNLGLGTAATTASTDYATAAQGATADTATQPGDNISTLTNDSGFITGLTAGALSDFDFDDNAILGFGASVNTPTITANAYTVTDADNGKVLALDNGATAMNVNINTGLPAGFNCSFIQTGSGQVTFAGTATLNNRQSHTKINAQYGVASIVAYATDTYILAGDTTA